jgi:hypothetical protein
MGLVDCAIVPGPAAEAIAASIAKLFFLMANYGEDNPTNVSAQVCVLSITMASRWSPSSFPYRLWSLRFDQRRAGDRERHSDGSLVHRTPNVAE